MNPSLSLNLTRSQRETYTQLETPLQSIIKGLLNNSTTITIAQKALTIISRCNKEAAAHHYNPFFCRLLNPLKLDVSSCLDNLLEIVNKQKGNEFFASTVSSDRDYHSSSALSEIITIFHRALLSDNLSVKPSETVKTKTTSLKIDELINCKLSIRTLFHKAMSYLASLDDDQRLPLDIYQKLFERIQSDPALNFSSIEKVYIIRLFLKVTSSTNSSVKIQIALVDLIEVLEYLHSFRDKSGEEALFSFCNLLIVDFEEMRYMLKSKELSFEKPFNPLSGDEDLNGLQNQWSQEEYGLSEPALGKIFLQYSKVQERCKKWSQLPLTELVNLAILLRLLAEKKALSENEVLDLLAIGRLAYRLHSGKYAYNTQVLVVLGILFANEGKSTLAQVKTGQGKSLVVTLLAFCLVMQNKAVDIISSAKYLAIRDCQVVQTFFGRFHILTSHICEKFQQSKHFKGHILYGTASDFEFAIMHEQILFKVFFNERTKLSGSLKNFDTVIVDEVDNLTIDTLMNSARISLSSEDTYEWVYRPILEYTRGSISNTFLFIAELREYLGKYMEGRFANQVSLISNDQLERWFQSAKIALKLSVNKDYIIKEKKKVGNKQEKKVVIVDAMNTGRLIKGSRWENGLHEFVEAKHDVEIQVESIVPISLSHAVYYQKYTHLYGLTGTLGSRQEREEISNIYNLNFFDVPPHQACIRKDLGLTMLQTKKEATHAILQVIQEMYANDRPTLVICLSIDDSGKLAKLLQKENLPFQLLNEVQNEKEEEIILKAGKPSQITIATNTAGRGTDICLDNKSCASGGLHVILTYYPDSQRVEEQAIGRAGRQGQPGSSQIILSLEQTSGKTQTELLNSRSLREFLNGKRHLDRVHTERYIVKQFVDPFLTKLKRFHDQFESEVFVASMSQKLINQYPIMDLKPKSTHQADKKFVKALILQFKKERKTEEDIIIMKSLLFQLSIRIKNKVILLWTTQFYKPLYADLESSLDLDLLLFEQKAGELFETQKVHWEPYLDPTSGLILYLKSLIDFDFSQKMG